MHTDPEQQQPEDQEQTRSGAGHEEASASPGQAGTGSNEPSSDIAALEARLEQLDNQYRRALADLDNYRKRTAREAENRAAAARDATVRDWLEARDSVERALGMEPDDPGLTAVLEQMDSILARSGIHALAQIGDMFDPSLHEAIAAQPTTDVPDRTVMAVARSGFGRSDGTVIRPAQVVVARNPPPSAGDS